MGRNPLKKFVIVIFSLLMTCLLVILLAIGIPRLEFTIKLSSFRTAENFVEALRTHNIQLAKALVIPEQHHRIEQWVNQHEVVVCPKRPDLDVNESWNGIGDPETLNNPFSRQEYGYFCFAADYSFRVSGMTLEKKGIQWQIIDWEEICERQGEHKDCQ